MLIGLSDGGDDCPELAHGGYLSRLRDARSPSTACSEHPSPKGATSRMSIPGSTTAPFWRGAPSTSYAASTPATSRPRAAIASHWPYNPHSLRHRPVRVLAGEANAPGTLARCAPEWRIHSRRSPAFLCAACAPTSPGPGRPPGLTLRSGRAGEVRVRVGERRKRCEVRSRRRPWSIAAPPTRGSPRWRPPGTR